MTDGTAIQEFRTPSELFRETDTHDAALRTLLIDGEPWFIARDLARLLGYRDAANAARSVEDDEKGTHEMSTPGGLQTFMIINESGFYRLVLRSNRPEAKAFQRWVTREVLPQIRQTGAFTPVVKALTRKELLLQALEAEEAREAAEQRADELVKVVAARQAEVNELLPAAQEHAVYLDADGLKPVGVVAQQFGIGQTRMFEFLREQGVLISTAGARFNTPKQAHIETGRFRIKSGVRDSKSEGTKPTWTTMVTPKGEQFIYRLIKSNGSDAMLKALDKVTSKRIEAEIRQTDGKGEKFEVDQRVEWSDRRGVTQYGRIFQICDDGQAARIAADSGDAWTVRFDRLRKQPETILGIDFASPEQPPVVATLNRNGTVALTERRRDSVTGQ